MCEINLTNLTKLELDRNQLTELPKKMDTLTCLTEFRLYSNPSIDLTKDQKKWL